MAIPIPSEERTLRVKLWRATQVKDTTRNVNPDVLLFDRRKRQHEQEGFVSRTCNLLIPGATTPSPVVLAKECKMDVPYGKGHTRPAPIVDHPQRKRDPKGFRPMSEDQVLEKLWAPGGMTDHSEKRKAQSVMEMHKDREIALLLSPQKRDNDHKKTFPELRAYQEERSRSTKGDASLAVNTIGVRRVNPDGTLPNKNPSVLPELTNPSRHRSSIIDRGQVQGFQGMKAVEMARNTGTKRIEPFSQPWDPLGLKAKFNSGGHPMMYSGQP